MPAVTERSKTARQAFHGNCHRLTGKQPTHQRRLSLGDHAQERFSALHRGEGVEAVLQKALQFAQSRDLRRPAHEAQRVPQDWIPRVAIQCAPDIEHQRDLPLASLRLAHRSPRVAIVDPPVVRAIGRVWPGPGHGGIQPLRQGVQFAQGCNGLHDAGRKQPHQAGNDPRELAVAATEIPRAVQVFEKEARRISPTRSGQHIRVTGHKTLVLALFDNQAGGPQGGVGPSGCALGFNGAQVFEDGDARGVQGGKRLETALDWLQPSTGPAVNDATLADMNRRGLLKLGLAGTVVLAAAGGGAALMLQPGWHDGRLSPAARAMFRSVALAVLDSLVPTEPAARSAALDAWLQRLETTLSALAPATQAELAQICTLLPTAPGRLALAGLGRDWTEATTAEVQSALQALRTSRLAVRQQLFHALRDLSNAAWFADPGTWPAIGYPGPPSV